MSNSKIYKSISMPMIFIIALGIIYISSIFIPKAYFALSFYIVSILLYMIIKSITSFPYKIEKDYLYNYSVSVVMVVEGEDSEQLIATIKSLLNQEYLLKEIIIINRNSKNLNIYNMAKRICKQVELFEESGIKGEIDLGDIKNCPNIIIKRLVDNEDKEVAESWGFTRSTGEIILTCKPNSIINKDEIKDLIKPFEDSSVLAVIGKVKINRKEFYKLLKRLLKAKNGSKYEEFKVQYKFKDVLFCDSSLSCYRREAILSNKKMH